MNEPTQFQAHKAASCVWLVFKRTLAVIVILIATIGFLANAAGLAGMWVVRRPARDTVTALSTFVNDKLGLVDQALVRVNARADDGRQALAQVNNAVSKLSDHLEENSPLLTALTGAVRDDLAPKIAEMRAQALALRDGVISVNAALETLNSFGFITVPTLSDELGAVSERVNAAQSDVQELRLAIDEVRTGVSANLVAGVTARTIKIDNVMAQIKSTTVKYQAAVTEKRQQVTDLSHKILRAINLIVLLLTGLLLVVAAGQVLLIYVCWQYVRRGRFPSLRVLVDAPDKDRIGNFISP
jgi:predicted  nucleic acid-binding Zn-ribbon protein